MRPVALLPLAALATACSAQTAAALPPVVEIPVAPAAATPRRHAPAPTIAAVASPDATPPWVERVERRETTKRVALCQIEPFSFSSVLVVENRLLAPGRVAMRVVQDDEHATGVPALPGLLGKGYVVTAPSPHELAVRGSNDEPVPEEQVARVRALAAAFLAWPGPGIAGRTLAPGEAAPSLAGPVVAVAAVPLHGASGPSDHASAVVRVKTASAAGDVLDVSVTATEGDAGMCHRWTNRAALAGELHLRARDGALLGLHLEGTTDDTEGLCQRPDGKPGPPPPPRTCNRGTVTVDVRQPEVP